MRSLLRRFDRGLFYFFLCGFTVFFLFIVGCDSPKQIAPADSELTAGAVISFNQRGNVPAPGTPLPGIPDRVDISQTNTMDIQVNWDTVVDASSYRVYVAEVGVDNLVEWVKYSSDSPPFELADIVSDGVLDIYVAVSAANLAGEGESSATVALVTSDGLIDGPITSSKETVELAAQVIVIENQSPYVDEVDVDLDSDVVIFYKPNDSIKEVFLRVTGSVPVFGQASESLGSIRFTPDSLEADTDYQATVTFFVADVNGDTVKLEGDWMFATMGDSLNPDTDTPPPSPQLPPVPGTIVLTLEDASPTTNEMNVAVDTKIKFTFSAPIDLNSVKDPFKGIIVLGAGDALIEGSWSSDGNNISFKPIVDLQSSAQYWIFLRADITDISGIQYGQYKDWSFMTAGPTAPVPAPSLDTTGPGVNKFFPGQGAPNAPEVLPANGKIRVTFDEPILLTSVNNGGAIVQGPDSGFPVPGAWTTEGNDIVFNPSSPLESGKQYIYTLNPSWPNEPIITDLAGNKFGGRAQIFFRTESTVVSTPVPTPIPTPNLDITPPGLGGAFYPGMGSPGAPEIVPVTAKIRIVFDEPISLSSVTNGGGTVHEPTGAALPGVWTTEGNDLVFTPTNSMEPDRQHWYTLNPNPTGPQVTDWTLDKNQMP